MIKPIFLTLSVLLAVGTSVLQAQTNARLNAIEQLKNGDRQMVMRNWPLAEQAFANAIQLDIDFAEAYMKRARLYQITGRYQESIKDYDRAISLNPFSEHIFDKRAKVKFLAFDHIGSDKDFRMALSLYPDDVHLRDEYINELMERNEYEEALVYVDSLISIESISGKELLKKAVILISMKDYTQAQFTLDQAREKLGSIATVEDVEGLWLISQNYFEEAVVAFTKAIELDPEFALAYQNRSMAYRGLGEMEKAKADVQKAMEVNAHTPNLLFARALLRKESGDMKGASQDYARALELNPSFQDARYNKVYTNKILGNFLEASITAEKLVNANPENADNWNLLGNVYLIYGEYPKAIDSYNRSLNLNPEFVDALFNRGLARCMNYALSLGCADLEDAAALGSVSAKEARTFFCDY